MDLILLNDVKSVRGYINMASFKTTTKELETFCK